MKMKKNRLAALKFLFSFVLMAAAARLLGALFDYAYFSDWTNDLILGLAYATAVTFGPPAEARLKKKFRKGR